MRQAWRKGEKGGTGGEGLSVSRGGGGRREGKDGVTGCCFTAVCEARQAWRGRKRIGRGKGWGTEGVTQGRGGKEEERKEQEGRIRKMMKTLINHFLIKLFISIPDFLYIFVQLFLLKLVNNKFPEVM